MPVVLRRAAGAAELHPVEVALRVVGEAEPRAVARRQQQREGHVGDDEEQRHVLAAADDEPLPPGDADGREREVQQRVGAPEDGHGQDVPVGVPVLEGEPLRRVAVDIELVGGEEGQGEEPEDQDGRRQGCRRPGSSKLLIIPTSCRFNFSQCF